MESRLAWRLAIVLVAIPVLMKLGFVNGGRTGAIRRVGIPDGSAGLIARYVLAEKMDKSGIQSVRFEACTLYDCCASSSQYAMSSGRLDLAIMCSDAARTLVDKDRRYEIVGPVMKNSDIFIVREDVDAGEPVIAVSQKRRFQQDMVARRFGKRSRPEPMLHAAVPFAYARGVVHGAVMDIAKAFYLDGVFLCASVNDTDIRTYVLVGKKTLNGGRQWQRFLESYNEAVEEMQDPERLLVLLKRYVSNQMTMGEVEIWKKLNVGFMSPLNCRRQG